MTLKVLGLLVIDQYLVIIKLSVAVPSLMVKEYTHIRTHKSLYSAHHIMALATACIAYVDFLSTGVGLYTYN